MENFSRSFFSMRMMTVALFVFLSAIAMATFYESAYDIQTAKIKIYNALWFEVLLVYLSMNLIANIFKYKMLQREKIAMLTFHLSFIVIIIGAAVTRFVSFEGLMIIGEGQRSNFIYSSDPHLWFKINDGKLQYTYAEKKFMSEECNNDFGIDVDFPNHKAPIKIEYVNFQKKMVDSVVVNDSIQGVTLDLVTEGMRSNYLSEGDFMMSGDVAISFEKKDAMQSAIRVGRRLFNKTNPDYYGMQMLNTILGGYFGSRLMSNIREDKGYTYGIGSGVASMLHDGFFYISTEVGVEVTKATLTEIYKEIERLQNDPVDDNELDLVKNYMLGTFLRSVDGPFAISEKFTSLKDYGLTNEFYKSYVKYIKQANPKDLQHFAQKYLNKSELSELVVGKL
jgi:hypothetical protein